MAKEAKTTRRKAGAATPPTSANDDENFGQLGKEIREALLKELAGRDAAIKVADKKADQAGTVANQATIAAAAAAARADEAITKADEAIAGVAALNTRPLVPPSALEAFRRGLRGE